MDGSISRPHRLPWYWPLGAATAVAALCLLAPAAALLIGPFVALAFGTLAAWAVAREGGATPRRTAAAGALVGLGCLIGAAIGLGLVGYALGGDAAVQALVRTAEPHPQARVPSGWIPPLGAGLGAVAGLLVGLAELSCSTLAAWLYGVAARRGCSGSGRAAA